MGRSVDGVAVDGGADGVRDADAALGGDAASFPSVDSPGQALEAVACGLPVGLGLGGSVEAPNAAAAARRRAGAAPPSVGKAGAQGRVDLTTGDGGAGGVRCGEEHRCHHGDHHELSG
ncbi:unnamed protein product [Alopecurus aequalis]